MSLGHFFRLKKLRGSSIMLNAAKHNRRAIQAELGAGSHIDSSRSHLNETLFGPPSPADVAKRAKQTMQAAGVVKLRRNAVVGLEALYSLPAKHTIDQREYFTKCVEWTSAQFGGDNIIMSADMHLDESHPHVHVLFLPLVNGRMKGAAVVGDRQNLLDLQTKFFDEVASLFGFEKPPEQLVGEAKTKAAARVIAIMRSNNDPTLKSPAWPVIRDNIESDPAPFLDILGAEPELNVKRQKSSTDIFISKGKGPKKEPEVQKPYRGLSTEKAETLSCVVFAPEAPPITAPKHAPSPSQQEPERIKNEETVRWRDGDMPSSCWDADMGDFKPPPPPKDKPQKAAARAWVASALTGISPKTHAELHK